MVSDTRAGTLSDLAQINPRRRIVKGSTAPFIEMAALPLSGRDVDPTLVQHRRAKGAGAHFQDGDTLLARITPCLENGKTAQVRGLGSHIVGEGSTEFIVLCGLDPADNDFVYYLCRDPEFRQFAIARMEGTSGRQRVVWQSIAGYPFNPPNAVDRRSAAEMLSVLDDRIDNLRATNATLEAIAQALFKSWFVDFDPVHAKAEGRAPAGMDAATAALFPSAFEDSELGPIPKGWRATRLESLCAKVQNGGTPSKRNGSFWEGGDVPWFKTGELFDGFLLNPSERITSVAVQQTSVRLLPKHAVLMAIYAAPTVGRLGILSQESAFNQACTGMIARDHVGPWFLFQTLRNGRDWFNNRANGAAQQNISKGIVENLPCVDPPEKVLAAFNVVAGPVYDRIEESSRCMATLASLRDTLLPRLISGKLRLPEAKVEDAVTETAG